MTAVGIAKPGARQDQCSLSEDPRLTVWTLKYALWNSV